MSWLWYHAIWWMSWDLSYVWRGPATVDIRPTKIISNVTIQGPVSLSKIHVKSHVSCQGLANMASDLLAEHCVASQTNAGPRPTKDKLDPMTFTKSHDIKVMSLHSVQKKKRNPMTLGCWHSTIQWKLIKIITISRVTLYTLNRITHNLAAHHRAAHSPAPRLCTGSVVCNLHSDSNVDCPNVGPTSGR